MDKSVPILISARSGTGIVTVVLPSRFCMTMWLPRWRTLAKPCCYNKAQS